MKILAIALNTGREAIRNRILYSILVFAVLVVAIAAMYGSASIGNPMKFVKDFSLASISLFGVVIAVMLGVTMLQKEVGRRTIHNILSKPVGRLEFIVGKFLGLYLTVAVIVAAMCLTLVVALGLLEGGFDSGLVVASGMTILELMIVVAVALLVSAVVVTPTVAGLVTAVAFVAGRSVGHLAWFTSGDQPAGLRLAAEALAWLLPQLHRFNVVNQVVYGDHVSAAYVGAAAAYAIAYAGILLVLASGAFSRREFA